MRTADSFGAEMSPLRVFGEELRHYRTSAELSQEQLGALVCYSGDLISKIEIGHRPPTKEFVTACDAVQELAVLHRPVGGAAVMREQVGELVRAARRPNIIIQVVPATTAVHEGLRGAGFVIAHFDDTAPAAYLDTAIRGLVIEDSDDINALMATWDKLRAEALPRSASLDLMEEVAKSWT